MEKSEIFRGLLVPTNYFELSEKEKKEICLGFLDTIYETIIKNTPQHFSKLDIFYRVLDQTIHHHEKTEEYEVCGLLKDTKQILDATGNNELYKY